jgi:hypothetical protein
MPALPSKHPIKRFFRQVRLRSWLSSILGWVFVLYVSATMLINYDMDTIDISGAVFVALSVLAGLAFTYAGVLPNGSQDRADIIYSGERLCQGAMIFLAASLLKHGTIVIPVQVAALSTWTEAHFSDRIELGPLVLFIQIMLFLVFVSGLLVAQLGYKTLGRVMVLRISRRNPAGGYFSEE